MKIEKITIKNYHSIISCNFEFADLLALIGKNNAGKSNIIYALNLFFSKDKPRDRYSFNNPDKPIEIIIEFIDLTKYEKEQIDEKYLSHNKLILKKSYSLEKDKINVKVTSMKDGEEIDASPRGAQNVLADTLPEFYLLPAVKYCSEELKMTKTTNLNKFLNLFLEQFEDDFESWDKIIEELNKRTHKTDDEAPLIKISEEISEALKEQFSEAEVKLKPKVIDRYDILNALDVFVDDDCELPLLNKGQGTQRAFIFAVLRLLANKINEDRPKMDKEKKDIIIAIEEPEIFLHPHQQRIIYHLFKNLISAETEQIQIIYSTHSSFMINIEDYRYLGLVTKNSIDEGTKITQCTEDIFEGDEKKEFKIVCQFDPERNELFFANKIILCEGDTEKFSLPIILDKVGISPTDKGISIIECGGKTGIPLFQKVLNKFNEEKNTLDYFIFYDLDIPPNKYKDESRKKELEEEARINNKKIEDLVVDENKRFIFNPDLERHLSIKVGEDDKPYKVRKKVFKSLVKIPKDLKDFIEDNFS